MLKKIVVIGVAIVVFACAVIINLAIFDLLSIDEVRASLGKILSVIGVSTYPGQTAFTVTPREASSAAAERVKPTTACFEAS